MGLHRATLGRYAKLRYTAIEPLARCYRRYAALHHATALLAAKDAIFAARRAVAQRKRHSFVPSLAWPTVASGAWTKIALTMDEITSTMAKITSTMAKIASTRSGFASSKAGFVLTKAQVASSYADEISQLPIQNWRSAISSRPFHW
ncbi:hypothetical protein PCASD_17596 [Puccinia coronata f. sp. avenae]|uniref:Uncharacterized protein n=1 Tax=Puccinia coronata f. sp. avenae TaxID=200324 RepID=A0A2N5TV36_9BASI|nr:hypothetical protein PCASD_17596 [Puccinia coronata f. sp. avenae]